MYLSLTTRSHSLHGLLLHMSPLWTKYRSKRIRNSRLHMNKDTMDGLEVILVFVFALLGMIGMLYTAYLMNNLPLIPKIEKDDQTERED